MTEEKQSIIKWACLLHNIGKIGKPTIRGRDYIYPFNSAWLVLKVMKKLKILDLGNDVEKENDYKEVQRLIHQSRQPLPAVMREDFR